MALRRGATSLVLLLLAPLVVSYVLPFHPGAYLAQRGMELRHHGKTGKVSASGRVPTDLPEHRPAAWHRAKELVLEREEEKRADESSGLGAEQGLEAPLLNDQPATMDEPAKPQAEHVQLGEEDREAVMGVLLAMGQERNGANLAAQQSAEGLENGVQDEALAAVEKRIEQTTGRDAL